MLVLVLPEDYFLLSRVTHTMIQLVVRRISVSRQIGDALMIHDWQ